MSILDCVGQDRAILHLQHARKAQRVPHGYVFHGPEGVGKRLLAYEWAKLLTCAAPLRRFWKASGAPQADTGGGVEIEDCCDKCADCVLAAGGNHPDLHVVNRAMGQHASGGRTRQMIDLPIDVIREFLTRK